MIPTILKNITILKDLKFYGTLHDAKKLVAK